MQRIISDFPIDEKTLENYEQSLAVLCRYFPPLITSLFATARRSFDGNLEWWSEREGQPILLNALPATEQAMLQEKCLLRQEAIRQLAEELARRGEPALAERLHTLLKQTPQLSCYGINGEPVQEIVTKDSSGDKAVQRDLSLTWAADLPAENQLTAGSWWGPKPEGDVPGVSVEAKVAESLKLKLGDLMTFTIAGVNREARVTSLRSINWDNFQPNFFMIFHPPYFIIRVIFKKFTWLCHIVLSSALNQQYLYTLTTV